MVRAAAPHWCRIAPPVVLGTTTFTHPWRDRPYRPGSVAAHTLTPPSTTTSTAPTTAKTHFCRGVSDSPSRLGWRPSMATQHIEAPGGRPPACERRSRGCATAGCRLVVEQQHAIAVHLV